MHHLRRVLLGGLPIGLVVALAVNGYGLHVPTVHVAHHPAVTLTDAQYPPPEIQAAGDIAAIQETARQAAVAQLEAEQAQALADQLAAARQKLLQAPPAATSQSQACADLAGIVNSVFGDQAGHALDVARRESGCTDTAYNPSGASGVFQLLGHQDLLDQVCPGVPNNAFDPQCNTLAAKILYDGSGWAPWAASGG